MLLAVLEDGFLNFWTKPVFMLNQLAASHSFIFSVNGHTLNLPSTKKGDNLFN